MEPTAVVTNVKISTKCQPVSLHTVLEKAVEHAYRVKENNNFIILKREFCCSLFKRRSGSLYNHVNVTKIKSLLDIDKILEELKKIDVCCRPELVVVDNITGQLDTHTNIDIRRLVSSNLQSLFHKCSSDISVHVRYNNEKFPGAFLKFFKQGRKLGTSIVFHSGKIVFVGCKCEEDLQCLSQLTHATTLLKSWTPVVVTTSAPCVV